MTSTEANLYTVAVSRGWKCNFRTRGTKRYVTINWTTALATDNFGKGTPLVKTLFPNSHMTSGSWRGGTYRIN